MNSDFSFGSFGAFKWRMVVCLFQEQPFYSNLDTQIVYLNLRLLFYSASRLLISGDETVFCSCESRFQTLVRKTLAQLHPTDVPQASSCMLTAKG